MDIRILLGGVFFLFGLSKFYPFIPTPPMMPQAARFIGAIIQTGYLWQGIGIIEIIGGLLILTNRFSLFGLILLTPIIVNIVGYLLVLQSGIGFPPIAMSIFLIFTGSFLAWQQREKWRLIFAKS